MKILITAVGKRIQLIKHLMKSFYVIGVDCGDLVPASFFTDKFYKVPESNSLIYIEELTKICEKEKVSMVIPLYEKEFDLLNKYRSRFEEKGIILLLSSADVIKICNNKYDTYNFFQQNDIDTPVTYNKSVIKEKLEEDHFRESSFPMIVKPSCGMGSKNVFKVNDLNELKFFIDYIEDPIVQQFVNGKEYTIDVLCDLKGNVISIVPRERVEIRSGEVSKTKTEKNTVIIEKVLYICSRINFIGPVTIQCIDDGESIKFIEINPRFGGGVPLTFESGVDYGKYLKEMILGINIESIVGRFQEKIMLRYDEAIIL